MASPTERILNLAAYADGRGAPISLAAITADVPGYEVDGPLVAGTPEWETARKRLQRDLADLRDHWGIDLAYDPDADGYMLAPPFLDRDERTALIAAATIVMVEGVEAGEPGAIGSAVDDSVAQVVVRVHALVATLRAAIARRSTVCFSYDGATRRVEPWALGTWRNRWYLAARDTAHGELRRFRLDRVEPANPTIAVDDGTDAFTVPDDFDVAAAFDLDPNSWGTDPQLHARVRVDADHVDAFLAELGGEIVARDAGAAVVELDVREYQSFRTRLLAFGGHARVESPPELVEVVTGHLRALVGDA